MLKRLFVLSTAFLLLANAAFAGPNQDKLKALRSTMSEDVFSSSNKLSASPLSSLLSPSKIWTLRQLAQKIPVCRETAVMNTLPGYEIHYATEVNAEALAGLFLPVAEALRDLEEDGSPEHQRALQNAIRAFEDAVVLLPDVNALEDDRKNITEDNEKNLEEEYDDFSEESQEENKSGDDGCFFCMDGLDDDVGVVHINTFGVEQGLEDQGIQGAALFAAGGSIF